MQAKPKLIRKKVGDRNYDIYTADGVKVGNVVMTGEYGRDNYPWDWSMSEDLHKQVRASSAPAHMKTQGALDSLRDAVDYIASAIAQYDLKP